ncbi:MAG: 4-(cytidine 5'-diphospho)-2-C-methyl-D-erythritol kinase [Ignavibacteriaceae bacterium]|nr:4-(cytidine 5'-diphospho)-2-C-methyl-D-erythritol kinase [Ignavibacteriaceae bacterium]
MKIIINSHAKINFGLNIIRKREDGFHDLNTIFYPVDLHDVLTFTKADAISLTTDSHELSADISSNLIMKSVRALEEFTNKKLPCKIHLEKKIPMGAGLGGGSSNAACTLLSLNDLYNLNVSIAELMKIAAGIGSDVACFLRPNPTFGESRGEKLTDIDFHINKPMVLLNPGIHVSTVWAYQNITPRMPDYDLRTLVKNETDDYRIYRDKVVNDFESPVFREFPVLRKLKEDFYASGAGFALMSGSGSTLFGIFSTPEDAVSFSERYKDRYFVFTQLPDNDESTL